MTESGVRNLCTSIEICSATHYLDDDRGLTVSNCIFADGAAAAILRSTDEFRAEVELLDSESGLFPRYREALRYKTQGRHQNRKAGINTPQLAVEIGFGMPGNDRRTFNLLFYVAHPPNPEIVLPPWEYA